MAEYKLPFTAKEIEEKLGKVGQPVSWNELIDQPFGDEVILLGDTITWDGYPTDVVQGEAEALGIKFGQYLVSESAPTIQEMRTATHTIHNASGNTVEKNLSSSDVTITEGSSCYKVAWSDLQFFVAFTDGAKFDSAEFPKKGIYFNSYFADGVLTFYHKSLKIPGYNFTKTKIHKLDPKYLPDGGVGYETHKVLGEVTIEWNGDPTGKPEITIDELSVLKVSDKTPKVDELLNGKVILDGVSMNITADMIEDGSSQGLPLVIVAEGMILVAYDAVPLFGIIEPGTYVVSEAPIFTFTYNEIETIIHGIDLKFLPEGGVGYEYVENFGQILNTEYQSIITADDVVIPLMTVGVVTFAAKHISENTPSKEDLLGGGFSRRLLEGNIRDTITITEDNIISLPNALMVTGRDETEPVFAVVYEDGVVTAFGDVSVKLPKKGIYSLGATQDGIYVDLLADLVIPDYNFTKTDLNKIESKYLPEHSWNNLEDKPFGEVPTNVGDTLTLPEFTPITSSDVFLKYTVMDGAVLGIRHIADSVPSKDDLIGGTLEGLWSDTLVVSEENLLLSDEIIAVEVEGTPIVVVALVDNATVNFIDIEWKLPKRGVYVGCVIEQGQDYYTEVLRKLTLPTHNFIMPQFKKIDPQYLPEGGFGYIEPGKQILSETILTASEDMTSTYILPIDIELDKTYEVTVDGTTIKGKVKQIFLNTIKLYYVGNISLFSSDLPDTGEDFVLCKYFLSLPGAFCFITHRSKHYPDTITASIKRCDHAVQIDPKYLPTDGFGYEVVKYHGGDTLEYDGTPTDVAVDETEQEDENGQIVRSGIYLVSNKAPTVVQLRGSLRSTNSKGTPTITAIYAGHIVENDDNTGYKYEDDDLIFYVALEDNITINNIQFPKKGIYIPSSVVNGVPSPAINSINISDFDFAESEIHKIDEKYLPDNAGTKIIDLTKYTADDGNSFNSAILSLFTSGGGSLDVPCATTTFWEDVNTTKPIKLKLDASALVKGATIYSDATAMVCDEVGAIFFSTTYAMYEPNSGAHIRTTVMFERYIDKIRMSLVLEPLTIPNNNAE